MSIDPPNKKQDDDEKPKVQQNPRFGRVNMGSIQPSGEDLGDLMQELDGVDETSPTAKLNKTSISDNNGGRIELDDKKRRSTRVNMSEWIPADALEQWQKDHQREQGDSS